MRKGAPSVGPGSLAPEGRPQCLQLCWQPCVAHPPARPPPPAGPDTRWGLWSLLSGKGLMPGYSPTPPPGRPLITPQGSPRRGQDEGVKSDVSSAALCLAQEKQPSRGGKPAPRPGHVARGRAPCGPRPTCGHVPALGRRSRHRPEDSVGTKPHVQLGKQAGKCRVTREVGARGSDCTGQPWVWAHGPP